MSRRAIPVLCILLLAWACGSSSTPKKPDAAIDAVQSTCGNPGDVGNEMGVGKYCETLADCSGNGPSTLCSSFGDPTTHFCTHTCSSTGSAGQCGSATTCECNASNQCGCTPNSCLM